MIFIKIVSPTNSFSQGYHADFNWQTVRLRFSTIFCIYLEWNIRFRLIWYVGFDEGMDQQKNPNGEREKSNIVASRDVEISFSTRKYVITVKVFNSKT